MSGLNSVLLLGFANLAVAFWGGVLLSFGLSFFGRFEFIRFDSVLAYLTGSFLAFLLIVFSRSRRRLPLLPISFLLLLPVATLFALTGQLPHLDRVGEWAFALSFCLYFGFGACLRAFRSDLSAHFHPRGLMVSELAYSTGYLLGLLVPVSLFDLTTILMGQLCTAPFVLYADFRVARTATLPSAEEKTAVAGREKSPVLFPFLVFLGMSQAVQISFQRLAAMLELSTPIAAFELGVTVAPILALVASAAFFVDGSRLDLENFQKRLPFFWVVLVTVAMAPVSLALMAFAPSLLALGIGFVAVCSFLYEYSSLVLLAQAGRKRGRVMLILGISGVVCSVSYWGLLHAVHFGAAGVIAYSAAWAALALFSFPGYQRLVIRELAE